MDEITSKVSRRFGKDKINVPEKLFKIWPKDEWESKTIETVFPYDQKTDIKVIEEEVIKCFFDYYLYKAKELNGATKNMRQEWQVCIEDNWITVAEDDEEALENIRPDKDIVEDEGVTVRKNMAISMKELKLGNLFKKEDN